MLFRISFCWLPTINFQICKPWWCKQYSLFVFYFCPWKHWLLFVYGSTFLQVVISTDNYILCSYLMILMLKWTYNIHSNHTDLYHCKLLVFFFFLTPRLLSKLKCTHLGLVLIFKVFFLHFHFGSRIRLFLFNQVLCVVKTKS